MMTTTTMEEQDAEEDGCSIEDEDEGVVINADDVHTYLGTLTTNDAVEWLLIVL